MSRPLCWPRRPTRTAKNFQPEFLLPRASTGHTRHYMPWFKPGPDDRTLVFDTFVVVPRDAPLIVRWPDASLDGNQRETLGRILANLGTLGRAESWCEARLSSEAEPGSVKGCMIATPLNGTEPGVEREIVRLLCPNPETAFKSDMFVDRTKRKPKRTATPHDPDWHLCAESLWLHKERWSDPPGSCWVPYTRPRDCFRVEPIKAPRPRSSRASAPQVVRFALDSAVLPLVTETLPVAEAARAALQCLYGEAGRRRARDRRALDRSVSTHIYGTAGRGPATEQERSVIFSGHEPSGKPCKGHRHAYYLPTAEGERESERLTHLTLVARGGFGAEAMRAIHRLREIRPRGRDNATHPLRVLLLGYGQLHEYQPPPLGSSRVWISATPYIATRHAKTRGRHRIDLQDWQARTEFLLNDLRAQLVAVRPDLDDHVSHASITPESAEGHFMIARRWRTIQFKRRRLKPSDRVDQRVAGAFRIEFPRPVAGLIAVGHSSHFGMGLFVPVKTSGSGEGVLC